MSQNFTELAESENQAPKLLKYSHESGRCLLYAERYNAPGSCVKKEKRLNRERQYMDGAPDMTGLQRLGMVGPDVRIEPNTAPGNQHIYEL